MRVDAARIGRLGEAWARLWLRCRGHRVIGRNWAARRGELDIVSRRGRTLHVVEVKSRWSRRSARPARALTPLKRLRILRATAAFQARLPRGCVRVVFSLAEVTLWPLPTVRFTAEAFHADDVRGFRPGIDS